MASNDSQGYDLLDRLAEEFAARSRRGKRPALEDYTDRYPELADEIRELFPALIKVEPSGKVLRRAVIQAAPARHPYGRWGIGCKIALALIIAIGKPARAAERLSAAPKKVYVGIYVKRIHAISLKESLATADFELWFRWSDDGLKPLDSFYLVNGQVESKQHTYEGNIGAVHYASCRVVATLNKTWDISRYPLDSHTITIEIEDNLFDADSQVYVPDVENSRLSPHAELAGWTLRPGKAVVLTNTDPTNYGDVSLPSGHVSSWSRFVYSIHVARPGIGIFVKLLAGLFIATAIALQALRVPAKHLDARMGVSVGAMFAAVASEYLVAGGLPESNGMTMAEALHILSFVVIFMTLAESILVYKMTNDGREAVAARLDRLCFRAFTLGYVAIALFIAAC
jgi:hypothetical protein